MGGHRPIVGQEQHAIKSDCQNQTSHRKQIFLVRHLPSKLDAHKETDSYHDQNVESEVHRPSSQERKVVRLLLILLHFLLKNS